MTGFSGRIFYTKNHASRLFPKMCFRYLNSGLRFLVTLVLILALAFFTCGVFIVFCRKCDDKVCTTIKFLTRASKISLPQTKKNSTPPDKGKYHSPRQRKISFPQTKENITLPDKGKYHSPRQRKISLSQTKENISPPDKGKYLSPRQRKISLPQTKENNTAPDKENITSQNKENISLPDKGKYLSPRQKTRHCVQRCCTWTRAPTWVSSEPSLLPPTQVSRVSCRTNLFCPEDSRKVTEAPTRGVQIVGKEAWEQVEDKFK